MSLLKIHEIVKKPKLNNPILIEGLPGIGNVGKVAVDYIVEELKAIKIYEISSYTFPSTAFVGEDNLIELPKINLYFKKMGKGKKDLLFLAGDIQPVDEVSSFEFAEEILSMLKEIKGSSVVALGGIGLMSEPKNPKIYLSGSTKEAVKSFMTKETNDKMYGVVGPIMGVSGLLVGMAPEFNIPATLILSETFAHPMYLGVTGAKKVIELLDSKLSLGIDVKKFEKETKEMGKELIKHVEDVKGAVQASQLKKITKVGETNYIG